MTWDDVRTWKHDHVCQCGARTTCWNPDCSEPVECPSCRAVQEAAHEAATGHAATFEEAR